MNNKEYMLKILEKLNNIENYANKNKVTILESEKQNILKELEKRSTFGRNLKYNNDNVKKALDDYYNYIVWNGLKYKNRAIDEISKRYGYNKIDFINLLKKEGLYDMQVPSSELRENFNIRNKIKKKLLKRK